LRRVSRHDQSREFLRARGYSHVSHYDIRDPTEMLLHKAFTLGKMCNWAITRRLMQRKALQVPCFSRVAPQSTLIVSPHPDDEVFGAGGLIALKIALGVPVNVVFLTAGETSHKDCCGLDPATVGFFRRKQAYQALSVLGLASSRVHWAGLPCSRIPHAGADGFKDAVSILSDLINITSPGEVFAPHPLDSWPDHEAASELTRAALKRCYVATRMHYYLIWARYKLPLSRLGKLGWDHAWRLSIANVTEKKTAAIACYLEGKRAPCGSPYGGRLPVALVKAFREPYELFFDVIS